MLGPETLLKVLDKDCPFKNPKKPKITFLDNIDPYTTHQVIKRLNFGKTLFLVQTKSGGTPETLAQYLIFRQKVRELGLEHNQHFVFVTDPEGGYLNKVADQTRKGILTFFDTVGPVWNFFFVKTHDPDPSNKNS